MEAEDVLIDEGIDLVDPNDDGEPPSSPINTRKRSLDSIDEQDKKRQRVAAVTPGTNKRFAMPLTRVRSRITLFRLRKEVLKLRAWEDLLHFRFP